jgi:hypothetical protein
MSQYLRYLDKSREFFLQQGMTKPYIWPHLTEVPFTPLKKPLSECRITIITTSRIALKSKRSEADKKDVMLGGDVYEIESHHKASDLYGRHEGFDRFATNIDDVDSFYPTSRLHESVADRRVGSVTPFFYAAYANFSQKKISDVDAPEVLKRCRENNVDVAILTPI